MYKINLRLVQLSVSFVVFNLLLLLCYTFTSLKYSIGYCAILLFFMYGLHFGILFKLIKRKMTYCCHTTPTNDQVHMDEKFLNIFVSEGFEIFFNRENYFLSVKKDDEMYSCFFKPPFNHVHIRRPFTGEVCDFLVCKAGLVGDTPCLSFVFYKNDNSLWSITIGSMTNLFDHVLMGELHNSKIGTQCKKYYIGLDKTYTYVLKDGNEFSNKSVIIFGSKGRKEKNFEISFYPHLGHIEFYYFYEMYCFTFKQEKIIYNIKNKTKKSFTTYNNQNVLNISQKVKIYKNSIAASNGFYISFDKKCLNSISFFNEELNCIYKEIKNDLFFCVINRTGHLYIPNESFFCWLSFDHCSYRYNFNE